MAAPIPPGQRGLSYGEIKLKQDTYAARQVVMGFLKNCQPKAEVDPLKNIEKLISNLKNAEKSFNTRVFLIFTEELKKLEEKRLILESEYQERINSGELVIVRRNWI